MTPSSPDFDEIPLPHGWVEEFHESGHPYYVDTLANPPRSIWIHPYEDEQYLQQHPEDGDKLQAWVAAHRSRSPSPSTAGKSPRPLYAGDVKAPDGSSQEFSDYGTPRGTPRGTPALGMTSGSPMGNRGLLGERGISGRGERGLVGGLLGGRGLIGALVGRAEMAEEGRGAYYDPRFGMGGAPGMMMGPSQRGFGIVDRRMERDMRHQEKLERRMQHRQEKFERRRERRFGGRYTPPSYARPAYYPGQYSMGYGQQYGGPSQFYAPPPTAAIPHREEHHEGKVLPFLGGVAVGVAGDELFHHFKDKKEDKD